MTQERHTFRSSRVSRAVYDTEGFTLLVTFPDGNHFRYFEVPRWVWQDFITAPSAGRFLNEVLAKNYRGS